MKVIATGKGFYGRVIDPGEVFEVDDKVKGSWFKPVGKGVKETSAAGNTTNGKENASTQSE